MNNYACITFYLPIIRGHTVQQSSASQSIFIKKSDYDTKILIVMQKNQDFLVHEKWTHGLGYFPPKNNCYWLKNKRHSRMSSTVS